MLCTDLFVCKIASAPSGHQNFLSGLGSMIQNQYPFFPVSCPGCAHQPRRTGADNDNIKNICHILSFTTPRNQSLNSDSQYRQSPLSCQQKPGGVSYNEKTGWFSRVPAGVPGPHTATKRCETLDSPHSYFFKKISLPCRFSLVGYAINLSCP